MGIMDKVKGMLEQHGDKVGLGLDKAAEAVDSKTGGKYSGQIKSGTQKAKEAIGAPSDDAKDEDGKSDNGKSRGKQDGDSAKNSTKNSAKGATKDAGSGESKGKGKDGQGRKAG